MDSRTALSDNTVLLFGDNKSFTVEKEIARGGSSIVYSAFYIDNAGCRNPVLIKECYPFRCRISRSEDNSLNVSENDKEIFRITKNRLLSAYKLGNSFFGKSGLTNLTANTYEVYYANNTMYIISAYLRGQELSYNRYDSVKDCVSVVKRIASTVRLIHNAGYLYLDIKPGNVFTLDETTDIIQLFDFDSLIPIDQNSREDLESDDHISYTKGYAALELQRGDYRKIGKQTDVYGIGAVLFYLFFNRVPSAADCSMDSVFDYEKSKLSGGLYRDRLYSKLTDFFHNTLANYYLDRYPDMDTVIKALSEIEKLADTHSPYIIGTRLTDPSVFIGRKEALEYLTEFMEDKEQNCLFVTGIGGIGKSTLTRKAVYINRDLFDNILFVNFEKNIETTITNDITVHINNVSRDRNESAADYLDRKLLAINKIAKKEKTLLVIDNFTDDEIGNMSKLISLDMKWIFITRNMNISRSYRSISVGRLKKASEQYCLFETNLNRKINENELRFVDDIISCVDGHTLVMELIAKQIGSPVSKITVEEAAKTVKGKGFSRIAVEKVDYEKDLNHYRGSVEEIICNLFLVSDLNSEKKMFVRIISIFGDNGISISDLCTMLETENRDNINELYCEGWINIMNQICSVHPVIRETISHIILDDDTVKSITKIMRYVKNKISEGINADCKNISEYSKHLTAYCRKYDILTDSDIFRNFLYSAIRNIPRENERFIRENSEYLIDTFDIGNKNKLLDLYEGLTEIYYEHFQHKLAYKRITELKKRIRNVSDLRVVGRYYYLLTEYYDFVLSGRYDSESERDKKILFLMLKANDKAIKAEELLKKSDSGLVLAEYLRSKALLLIRSGLGRKKDVMKILIRIKKIINKSVKHGSRIVRDYDMTLAWYYTYLEPDFAKVTENIKEALKITDIITPDEIDRIDEVIYPTANILLEWGKYDEAAKILKKAITICTERSDIRVYYFKKLELYRYLLDVFFYSKKYAKCMEIIEILDKEACLCSDMNIEDYVSEEIRSRVLNYK